MSTVETAVQGVRAWCFTNGHAVEAITEFHADLDHLDRVDWDVIGDRLWRNTPDDLDRKRRKQAEFLVHSSVPWTWIHRIGVADGERLRRVDEILAGAAHRPDVAIERGWYY